MLKKSMRTCLLLIVVMTLIFTSACKGDVNEVVAKVDDWEYSSSATREDTGFSSLSKSNASFNIGATPDMAMGVQSESGYLGFSVGGAMDINNFRENIKNQYLPLTTDITHEGMFYEYTFDTGKTEESTELFSPSYSYAVSNDPISGEPEYYLSVGLNSNIKESDFIRKKLNLVVLLDISGSMSSRFDSYYYDDPFAVSEGEDKTKMQIANEAVNVLIDQLKDDDRFGMVLFDDTSYLAKPLNLVSETDMDAIKEHILEIKENGGTNFEAGYIGATEIFDKFKNANQDEYENRIIVLTDAMPNIGTTSRDDLLDYVQKNVGDNIYTTFVGIGVDFNSEFIQTIGTVKGANYYSVHNSQEFKTRMGEQFEYMVTPLVFDLKLDVESDDYEIKAVYGSTEADKATGNIMYVNTLFPAASTDTGEVKGGLVLLKLAQKSQGGGNISLSVSYKDRNGESHSNSQSIEIQTREGDYYPNTGIRKGIALTRYVNTLQNWIMYERSQLDNFEITRDVGIVDFDCTQEQIMFILGEHERQSMPLTVSGQYKDTFAEMRAYLEKEINDIGDETMRQEIEMLNLLL